MSIEPDNFPTTGLTIMVGSVSTVWITIGGTLDLRKLFKRLKTLQVNANDDGRVIGHMNADDFAAAQAAQATKPQPGSENGEHS